jgi:hypothetical protein
MKTKWFALALIAIAAGLIAALLMRHEPKQVAQTEPTQAAPVRPALKAPPPPPLPVEQPVAPMIESMKQAPVKPVAKAQPQQQQQQAQPQKQPKEPLHDPEARDALALVGIDPEAEQYWLQAIFDTSLPDKERDDLMEDLNEVGFADPKNPGPDDLPLIASRLRLIEQIAPDTDDFMAEHLGEAYKDLANMYARVSRQ